MDLDMLTDEHVGEDGSFMEFLDGKVVQSVDEPPDFVDPAWLQEPDVSWGRGLWRLARPKRIYLFADARQVADVSVATWSSAIEKSRMRPERKAVALAVAGYADILTGKGVRPAQSTVAKALGKSRENVNRSIKRLVSEGWLIQTGKAGRGVIVYALAVPGSEVSQVNV